MPKKIPGSGAGPGRRRSKIDQTSVEQSEKIYDHSGRKLRSQRGKTRKITRYQIGKTVRYQFGHVQLLLVTKNKYVMPSYIFIDHALLKLHFVNENYFIIIIHICNLNIHGNV
jgi:hypothetical protein